MRASLLLIFLIFSISNHAMEPGDKASSLYSIKDYAKAKGIYQEMLTTPLPAWEKAIIQYNIGTILLAEGRWNESRNQFNEIILGSDPSPLLLRYLKTNMSVNTIRQAYTLLLKPPFDIEKIEWLLNTSLKEINEASEAECAFMSLEETSKQDCIPPHDLIEMHKTVSQLLFNIQQSKRESKFKTLTLDQRYFLLIDEIEEIEEAIQHLKILNQIDDSSLKTSYQDFFYQLFSSHPDLWKDVNPSAHKAFEEGIIALKDGDLKQSALLLNKSLQTLKDIQNKKINENTLTQNIEELLFRYEFILAQNPIDLGDVIVLEQDQNKLIPIPESNKLLSQSREFLEKNQESAARFFLQEAAFQIENPLLKAGNSPEDILKKLITSQKQALKMNVLYQQIDKALESAKNLLIDNQQIPVKQAGAFIEAALLQQDLSYQKDEQCQWQPWDKVFPLFDQGYSQAHLAANYITQQQFINALQPQDIAIKKWEEALKELSSNNKPQQTPEQIPQQAQNLLNLVQEMELQDRPTPSKTPLKTQEGVRPW